MTIDDIKQLIPKKCEEITEILGIPEDEAIILCAHYKWRKDLVESEYFEDQEKIRKRAGIDPEEVVPLPTTDEITCQLCFDAKPKSEFDGLKCNHILCKDCWAEYIEYNVKFFCLEDFSDKFFRSPSLKTRSSGNVLKKGAMWLSLAALTRNISTQSTKNCTIKRWQSPMPIQVNQ